MRNPFRYFNSSPEVIRLTVMMYIRYPLSLRQVEDILFERGIDVSHVTIRFWWNRFGPMFAAAIRKRRPHRRDRSLRRCTCLPTKTALQDPRLPWEASGQVPPNAHRPRVRGHEQAGDNRQERLAEPAGERSSPRTGIRCRPGRHAARREKRAAQPPTPLAGVSYSLCCAI